MVVDENEISGGASSSRLWMEKLQPVQNPPQILAVVVGINRYTGDAGYPDLTGAVDDANAFEQFLLRRLQVPKGNIRSLRDGEASREGIIQAFFFLRDTKTPAGKDCQIIFYYAGHGAQEDIPKEWKDWKTPTGRIEMLCPSDIGTRKPGEETVPGIPDRTISALLNQISQKKGDHITVILDCCSSAGMNRGAMDEDALVPRQIYNAPPIHASVDKKYLHFERMRKGDVSKEYTGRFRASHVLLAACGREQLAWEDPNTKSGIFTSSLLKILSGDELDTLTYRSLMDKLAMPKRQTPHCEGKDVNRLLFGNKELSADTAFIYGRNKEGRITVDAGTAQGITVGSQFSVHNSDTKDTTFYPNPCLGYLEVKKVANFTTLMVPKISTFYPPVQFYCKAVQSAPQAISIYSRDKKWLSKNFPPKKCSEISADVVGDSTDCDLELAVEESLVYLIRHNDDAIRHIGARMRQCIPKDDTEALYRVIKAASHYKFHLKRTSPNKSDNVRMEIHALESVSSEGFEVYHDLKPVGENLLASDPATITVQNDRNVGMTIINDTDMVLYPYLFYFDPNDFSITDWYSPPLAAGLGRTIASIDICFPPASTPSDSTAANSIGTTSTMVADAISAQVEQNKLKIGVDAALPPRSRLAVGYGNSISEPWQFVIPKGQDKDIGYFRLFLSSRPGNFQSISQFSPFEGRRGMTPKYPDRADTNMWMVKTATAIQVPPDAN